MPEYPPDWCEQVQRECFASTRPFSLPFIGSLLGAGIHNRLHNILARLLPAPCIPYVKPSDVAYDPFF